MVYVYVILTIAVLCRAVKSDYIYFCRNGFVTKEDYLTFMISRETENVDSAQEVEEAFRAITNGGDKPFVTESQLQQVNVVVRYLISFSVYLIQSCTKR